MRLFLEGKKELNKNFFDYKGTKDFYQMTDWALGIKEMVVLTD